MLRDNLMGTTHEATASSGLAITAPVARKLIMTRDANELLASVAQETGLREGDVFRLALGMFKVAVDAKNEGKHVGVASLPEALDVEFTGF
jgi:hypothetical protein